MYEADLYFSTFRPQTLNLKHKMFSIFENFPGSNFVSATCTVSTTINDVYLFSYNCRLTCNLVLVVLVF